MADGGEVPVGAIPIDQFQPAKESIPPGAIPIDQFQSFEDKYSSPTELAKTVLEGAAQGLAGPLGTAAFKYIGNDAEGMRARQEANPILHGASQVGGLIAGGGGALKKIAGAVATSLPAKLAIENALFTAGDEISKYIKEDPHASVQSAILHTGLSGLLGVGAGKAANMLEPKGTAFIEGIKGAIAKRSQPELLTQLPSGEMVKGFDFVKDVMGQTKEQKAAEGLVDQLLKKAEQKGIGAMIGAKLGKMTSHITSIPYLGELGAYLGAKHLDKVLPAIGEKFMSSPTSVRGLKAALDTAEAVIKGEHALSKAAKSVFEAGSAAIPMPNTDKLKEHMEGAESDPTALLGQDNSINHYLPEHGTAQGMVMGRATSYLKSIKPDTAQAMPLSAPRKPSAVEKAKYNRALETVEQPLSIFDKVKNGTLTPEDILTATTVYPDIYKRMQEKLTEEMINHTSKGKTVPYKQALTLSLMLGMPLESSTLPQNMLANQATGARQPPSPQQAPISQPNANKGLSESKAKGLEKLSTINATPGQARVQSKLSR